MIQALTLMLLYALGLGAQSRPAAPLRLLHTVRLTGVHGRIDHFDADGAGQRLFMSALGNNTVEVFDLRGQRLIHTINGLDEPQGVTFVPGANRIFVANGGNGRVDIFDGGTYGQIKSVRLASDADDSRYVAALRQVFVGYGAGRHAGLAVFDAATGNLLRTLPLPAHPESFQLEESGPRIYVNLPAAGNLIAVVDRDSGAILARWHPAGAADNFPMALDAADHRLFIGCRAPAEVVVLDTITGRTLARLASVREADDLWYDAGNHRIFVSGGGGAITVIAQLSPDRYRLLASLSTPPGGRTSLLLARQRRFFLGIWGRSGRPEELQVYAVEP